MPDYQYAPLNDEHIRLLKLFPAQEKNAVLEGNLLIRKLRANDRLTEVERTFAVVEPDGVSFPTTGFQPSVPIEGDQAGRNARTVSTPDHVQEAEQYDALSYTWGGEPDPSRVIKILDGGQAYSIPITANLESALRQLRDCEEVKYLWVDALCINQVNHVEKGSQIPKIADIYNQATTVRVWLGEKEDNSYEALQFIRRVLNLGNLDKLVQDKLTSGGWAAFLDLMKRSWFSRRWIVQEIALAREAYLHCGEESVTWREFAEAVSLFTSKHHDVRRLFQGSELFDNHPDFLGEIEELGANRLVDASNNLFRKSDDGTIMEHLLSLEALMSSLSVFEASNPHDIVYAILWLANDAAPSTEEARGSSLNEHGVIHTPNPGSPSSDSYSRPASFPSPDLRTGRVTNDPAVYNAEGIETSEPSLPADMANEHSRPEGQNIQDRLAVPHSSQSHKRTASNISQPTPTIRYPGQGAVDGKITVDYNKSVFEVCKDFLTFAIAQSRSLDIMCRPWAPSPDLSKESELPSWVPKLSGAPFELVDKVYKRVEADPLVGAPGIGRKNYSACGKWRAVWHFQEDITRSLFVDGFVLDTVKVKSETAREGIIPAEWLKVVQWDHGKTPAPDRFWRTLVADRGPDGRRPPHIYQSAFNYAFQRKGPRGDLNIREMIIFGKCPSMAIDFLRRVLSVVWKRSLILTSQEEFLGLAPTKAREGDLVCILFGCSVPLVLRRIERQTMDGNLNPRKRAKTSVGQPSRTDSSKSDHYYELIGECYIHGMMDGEAIRHRRLKGLKEQEFELR